MKHEYGLAVIMAMMGMLVLCMLVVAVYRKRCKGAYLREALLILIIPVYQTVLVLCFFLACRVQTLSVLLFGMMLAVFSWAINIVVVWSLDRLEEKRRLERKLAQLYVQRQAELDYYRLNRANVEKMKQVKEELLAQLSQAERLIDCQNGFEDVKSVLDAAYQRMKRTQIYRFCDNPLLNSILSMKVKQAGEKGIRAEIRVYAPKEIAADPIDLCSLFCNLLDNAIEACERIEDQTRMRYLCVKADCRQGCLVLQVINSCEGKLRRNGDTFITGKDDREAHGLGLKLVERIVEKYHGRFCLEEQEDSVVVNVILNLAGNDGKVCQPDLLRGYC